jgi:hypothetical protein
MSIYQKIYYNICEHGKQLKNSYRPGSGLHKHHITPKHCGGIDIEDNYTYLTVREHIIAHFLLWKLYKNPNDLRSMKMLGAELSVQYRKYIGIYCRDNKIGFHGANKEQRSKWRKLGIETQKTQENSWWYWSTEKGRKHRASLGGKAGSKSQMINGVGIHTNDKKLRSKYASLGGKAIKGMICVTNGEHRTRIRPDRLDEFLSMGYRKGFILFS